MSVTEEKRISTEDIKAIMRLLHDVLNSARPSRWVAICALVELAIHTMRDGEPLKKDLLQAYSKHVQTSSVAVPKKDLII